MLLWSIKNHVQPFSVPVEAPTSLIPPLLYGTEALFSSMQQRMRPMKKQKCYQHLAGHELLAAYLFASWHLRRMPAATAEDRLQRTAWCRDYCNVFAGRWYALGATAWFVQVSPLGVALSPAGVPFLGAFFLVAFAMGIRHTIWQVRAQEKAGLPPIDPPEDMSELRRPTRRSDKAKRSTAAPGRRAAQPPRDQESAPPDKHRPPGSQ